MKSNKGLMSLWAVLLAPALFAQVETVRYSLNEAIAYAQQNGYTVSDKQYELQKAKKTIRETAAIGLPQVTAQGQYVYNAQIQGQPVEASLFNPNAPEGLIIYAPFGVTHQTTATIQASQLLFDGSYFVALQATRVYKEIANLDLQKSEIDIRQQVSNAYYNVLITQEAIRLSEENLSVIEKNAAETKALFEAGFLEEQDADQLQLLKNTVQNQLNNFKRQEELSLMLLKFNMGMSLDQSIELSDSIGDFTRMENSQAAAISTPFVLDEHIDYRIAKNNNRAANLQLKNERATYLPRLSAFARHSQLNADQDNFNAFNYDRYWAPGTMLGLTLDWTLFSGLARPAKVQKAKIDVQRTELAMEITETQLSLNYQQALSNYLFAIDNFEVQKQNIEISRKIRDRTTVKFKEGLSSSLDLTQAEQQFLDAQNSYLSSLQNLLTAKENLQNATGKIQ